MIQPCETCGSAECLDASELAFINRVVTNKGGTFEDRRREYLVFREALRCTATLRYPT
jgi:hypothetical protein